MRAVLAHMSFSLLLGLAAAQVEIPNNIDLENIDLENIDLDNINLDEIELPDGVEIPEDLSNAVPDDVELPTNVELPGNAQASATPTSAGTASAAGEADSLPALVGELPDCAARCLPSAADNIGCSVTDFDCLCRDPQRLVTAIGPCAAFGCDSADVNKAADIAPRICDRVAANPGSDEVASASRIVSSTVSSATASSDDNDSGAKRNVNPTFGLVGAAMLAALAV
ncbi:hypothetical protein ACRALDRAFT_1071227 [Sodiomyces alcalophilus JCM 7366]|uniref:uncharacterized protein n=1 Tax=Sodiomyces alcalophilus JCM 7366 TaxID=591952 RepID=UPI0039B6B854